MLAFDKKDLVRWLKRNALYFVVLVPFIAYIFLRSDLLYFDSYHYVCLSCGCDVPRNEAPLSVALFYLLPCNVVFFKLFLCGCCLVSLWFLQHTWRNAGYYALLFPSFLWEFWRFENDVIAYVFMFAAVFFFFRSYKGGLDFWRNQAASAFLVLVACGFWGGALFLPLLLCLSPRSWVMRGLSVVLLAVFGGELWAWFVGSFYYGMNETILGLAVLYLIPGVFLAMAGLPLWDRSRRFGLAWRVHGWPALALVVLKAKLVILGLIFLPVGIVLLVKRFPSLERGLLFASVGMVFFSVFALPLQEPALDVHNAVSFALDNSVSPRICHDWDIGYIVLWHGGDTNRHGMPSLLNCSGLTVSREDLNCVIIRDFGHYSVWDC